MMKRNIKMHLPLGLFGYFVLGSKTEDKISQYQSASMGSSSDFAVSSGGSSPESAASSSGSSVSESASSSSLLAHEGSPSFSQKGVAGAAVDVMMQRKLDQGGGADQHRSHRRRHPCSSP
ncbi:unnamed protein product [Amoebophrya sp. A25]|nr:unnamed protein product [Amoebophrya sp. A25]|eukprot:GSA25T00025796001.1